MSSLLKRKGGPSEAMHTPKRAKGSTTISQFPIDSAQAAHQTTPRSSKDRVTSSGWVTAFGVSQPGKEIAVSNGINGNESGVEDSGSDAEVYDDFVKSTKNKDKRKKRNAGPRDRNIAKLSASETLTEQQPQWKVSRSIGGRIADIDPVFVDGERYIVVALRNSLRVYSTSDSLLIRVIELELGDGSAPDTQIIAFNVSTTNLNLLWVARSSQEAGTVFCIDWTTGNGAGEFWTTSTTGMLHMTAASVESADKIRDVVFTTEMRDEGGWRIQAHELTAPGSMLQTTAKTIYTSTQEIQHMKTSKDGSIIVASSGARILIGQLRNSNFETLSKIAYTFRVFESTDPIFCLDLRVSQRSIPNDRKALKGQRVPVVDVVVGDVRGSIFVHDDLLSNLILAEAKPIEGQPAINLMPRKLHWHRKTVESVKWSRDSNYLISGGNETVMVLWQLDTGKHQFLPHMTAPIRNIVVSPMGASYAVKLGDNSAMVLSTAELIPTANISGLQAHVLKTNVGIDSLVERIKSGHNQRLIVPRTPALINPAFPSQILLAIGDSQESDPNQALTTSQPYLQTFDLTSSHNISRQALTRTNVTGRVEAPNAHRVEEARVTHMCTSKDGKWLATIDQWVPPRRDVEFLGHGGMDVGEEQRRRREVYLKFWKFNEKAQSWELVSRIDAPHTLAFETSGTGEVLSLVADPNSLSFSTVGEDSHVRIWRPRTRKRDELVVSGADGEALVDWKCQHAVALGSPELNQDELSTTSSSIRPEHAVLAYSDDSSLLAVSMSGTADRLVHLLSVYNGNIINTLPGLHLGDIISLAFLSQHLIILADYLYIYNLVTLTQTYAITLGPVISQLSPTQKAHMVHLATDNTSSTFAIALPTSKPMSQTTTSKKYLQHPSSEIAIFSPTNMTPILTYALPAFTTALLPAVGSAGYYALDSAAEITPLMPKSVQVITETAQPIADIQLDGVEEDVNNGKSLVEITDEEDDDVVEDIEMENVDENDDDDGPRVVSQQALAGIFDVGPAFALPPIEEMFYQVAGLFSTVEKGVTA